MTRIVALLALLVGCVPGSTQYLAPKQATLLVENHSLEILRVYYRSQRLGTIYPGEEKCITLWRDAGSYRLLFRHISEAEYSPYFSPHPGQGWVVSIYHVLQNDVFSLRPGERCGG